MSKTDKYLISSDEFMGLIKAYLNGSSEEFRVIYKTAESSNPLESRIQEEMRNYKNWTEEDLLGFVNNPKNHPDFRKKPALVVALYRLLGR